MDTNQNNDAELRMNKSDLKSNFGKRGWFIVIFFGVMLFFNSSFTADGMNIMVPILSEKNGWDPNLMLSYNGIAGWISVVTAFILSALVTKLGAKKVILTSLAVASLAFVGLPFFGNIAYWVVAVIIINTFCNGMSFCGGSALIAKWFPRKKGLAMGWSTMGNNLASAIFIPVFTLFMAGGIQMPFIGYFIVMGLMFVLGTVFIKDTPEELGISPDNAPYDHEELLKSEEAMKLYVSPWTPGKLLQDKEIWLMGLGYGLLFMATVGMVMQFVPRVVGLGFGERTAVTFLSTAAVIGIVASYLWGVVDQKCGTKIASMLLAAWFFAAILLNILPGDGTIYASVFMLGCAIGGNTNFSTSMCTSLFGRYNFSRAFNVVFPITCIFRAAASVILGVVLGVTDNNFAAPYIVFMIGSAVAFVLFALIDMTPKEA
jgi:MFS family permease